MSYTKALDLSKNQGDVDWQAVKADGYDIAIIKISGGDDGLYYDQKATQYYYGAKSVGIAVGGYHFAGATDPTQEADFFLNGMRPFDEFDVFVIDWEVQHSDPVAWVEAFVQRVFDMTNTWCLKYMNGSTFNSYNWDGGILANCGNWIAWYGRDPNGDLPVNGTYVMHQYTSTGTVAGISGNVDLDAFYGSVEQFKAYGYRGETPSPSPQPAPPDVPPVPEPTPIPVPVPVPEPTPIPVPEPAPHPKPPSPAQNWVTQLIAFLKRIFGL